MKNLTSQDKQILLQSYLFKGISLQELNHVLPCIGSELNTYSKDEYILINDLVDNARFITEIVKEIK